MVAYVVLRSIVLLYGNNDFLDIKFIVLLYMNKIIILLVIICIIIITCNRTEHFDNAEAIQNISSLYRSKLMTLTNLNVTGSFNLLPKGIISMWAGSIAPEGWALCDGTNGTPDLRSRFVVGAGIPASTSSNLTQYAIGTTGGLESTRLLIANLPAHTHALPLDNACFKNGGCDNRRALNFSGGEAVESSNKTNMTGSIGGGTQFDIRPPFYALAYIMKL
jgi:microcystin-dependent protein